MRVVANGSWYSPAALDSGELAIGGDWLLEGNARQIYPAGVQQGISSGLLLN